MRGETSGSHEATCLLVSGILSAHHLMEHDMDKFRFFRGVAVAVGALMFSQCGTGHGHNNQAAQSAPTYVPAEEVSHLNSGGAK
jgi:hypothetical protein